MSYYFAIIGTQDNPLFEHEFGTSKQGGDGLSRFSDQARHLNQFILHSSLDVAEEVQWNSGQLYVFRRFLSDGLRARGILFTGRETQYSRGWTLLKPPPRDHGLTRHSFITH